LPCPVTTSSILCTPGPGRPILISKADLSPNDTIATCAYSHSNPFKLNPSRNEESQSHQLRYKCHLHTGCVYCPGQCRSRPLCPGKCLLDTSIVLSKNPEDNLPGATQGVINRAGLTPILPATCQNLHSWSVEYFCHCLASKQGGLFASASVSIWETKEEIRDCG
jgi:hypothetical protein